MKSKNLHILLLILVTQALSAQNHYRNWAVKLDTKKEKIALVIANNQYESNGNLSAPIPTAKRLTATLKNQDIDVLEGHDLNRAQLLEMFHDFVDKLQAYQVGMVFYLGHGFQIDGENYLIPIDANPQSKLDVDIQAIKVDYILKKMDYPNKPKIVVLDACRDNPFEQNWTSTERSTNRGGLGDVKAIRNAEIFFTTQKNSKVRDDNPYLQYFMEELDKGGCIDDMARNISRRILQHDNQQSPARYGQLLEKVCFEKEVVKLTENPKPIDRVTENSEEKNPSKSADIVIRKPKETTPEKPRDIVVQKPQKEREMPPKKAIPTPSPQFRDFVHRRMVLIEGGSFQMGCMEADSNNPKKGCVSAKGVACEENEQPVHQVQLNDFYIGKYEVTNAEYCEFLNAIGNQIEGGATWLDIQSASCQIEQKNNQFAPKSGYTQYPVVEVTWYGANAYAQWVGMRLPTEAEWEYAARSRGQNETWAGTSIEGDLHKFANYNVKSDKSTTNKTTPIGKYQPNALGLYNMTGNVWEWCADWYDEAYYKNSPAINPFNQKKASNRVLRGGSWYVPAAYCRSSNRGSGKPNGSRYDSGFRLARSVR